MTFNTLRLPFVVLSLLTAVCVRAEVSQTFKQSYPLTADGTIKLENLNGDIEITGWDKGEVALEAVTTAKSDEDLKRVHLKIDPSSDRLAIKAEFEKKSGWFGGNVEASVHFKLMVPTHARLDKISSVNSDIKVKGVRGSISLDTVNGGIDASGLAADAFLESVNGRINAEFATVDQVKEAKLESVNGGITLNLPQGAGAALRTSTVNGDAKVEQPITLSNSSRHDLAGQIGTGGPTIKISTVNGGIHVREN